MLEKMFEKAQKKVDNGMFDRVALCPKNVISSFFGLIYTIYIITIKHIN